MGGHRLPMMPLEVISQAVDEHKPSHVFALFSGGHDSVTSTHIAAQHPAFSGVVHVNTGIGIEETREYVRQTCKQQGWPLKELFAPAGLYEKTCLAKGMPGGPIQHGIMYQYLKDDQLRALVREHKRFRGDRVGLVTGARSDESVRRMRVHPESVRREGAQLWINPILDWTGLDVGRYLEAQGISRNPVVDRLHRSGECICGALSRPEELDEIAFWYPEVAARIRLEYECFKRGLPYAWGSKPSVAIDDAQPMLPLCSSCATRWDEVPA
jgi:3'-phosphoadenosine 5'-phosphosulfate sulfotransferase (PAPS reductase)/FAD synthetase